MLKQEGIRFVVDRSMVLGPSTRLRASLHHNLARRDSIIHLLCGPFRSVHGGCFA